MPRCPGVQLARAGAQTAAVEGSASDATWDLTDAAWNNVAPDPIPYPVRSGAWNRGCIVGAHIEGNVPEAATRDQWYDGKHGKRLGGEVFRITLTNTPGNYLLFRDTLATDYEDAYDPNGTSPADTMYLDHVQARYIRDDCIENEGDGPPQVPMTVVVHRSLFDGCFSGFAERPVGAGKDSQNGSGGSSLPVDNSMMWIQPQPLGPRYCSARQARIGRCRATAQPKVWLGASGSGAGRRPRPSPSGTRCSGSTCRPTRPVRPSGGRPAPTGTCGWCGPARARMPPPAAAATRSPRASR